MVDLSIAMLVHQRVLNNRVPHTLSLEPPTKADLHLRLYWNEYWRCCATKSYVATRLNETRFAILAASALLLSLLIIYIYMYIYIYLHMYMFMYLYIYIYQWYIMKHDSISSTDTSLVNWASQQGADGQHFCTANVVSAPFVMADFGG